MGQWFINSSSNFFEWSFPQAHINVEHDRNPKRYDPGQVWISPISKVQLESALSRAQMEGKPLEIENDASLLFKVSTFPKTALIFLLSLLLATPLGIKKKARAILISLLAFALYFYFFIYFVMLYHMAVSRIGVYQLDGSLLKVVSFINRSFCNFGFSLTFGLIVWAITAIDFNLLFQKFNYALQGKPSKAKSKVAKRKKSNPKNTKASK